MTETTAKPDMVRSPLGWGQYFWLPACRCVDLKPNTSGADYCPMHGWAPVPEARNRLRTIHLDSEEEG